ncbi:telomere-binding protein 1-like [Miscanthus floridulus]|uniref:telomere-binding protein 1-like n=1 Tax=Miscanthus floridulus TaxID=154761 RepID=UPI00345A137B
MMVRKRLVYRSRGRRIPTMPRVPNSARGKRSTRRKKDENDMCAFDLLATVAGNLLADQDNSSNVPNTNAAKAKKRKSVKEEHFNEILPLKDVAMEKDVGSGSVSAFPRQANNCLAENSSTRNGAESILESLTMKSNMLAKIPECGSYGIHHPGSSSSAEPEQVQQAEPKVIRRQADGHAVACGIFDSVDVDGKPPALVSSDSSSCVPLSSHDKERQTSSLYRGEVQYTADRDDDENSSGCTHPSTIENKVCKPQYLGNHRIRKLLASKVRKAARNKICGGIPSKKICGGLLNKGSKLNLCGKKISTTRQKVQRTIFKKKKLAHHTTSFAKEMLTEASGTSFATGGQNKSCESENYHVKLRIKSFNIPELFIKVPENATIGSLKRTVMDVVNSIMEGGLRVGVLLQGKDIQDDNKTLCQAGICHDKKLNNIDFTLQCERERESPSGVIIPEQMDFLTADMVEPLARMKCEEPFNEADVGDDNQQSKAPYRSRSLSDLYSVHCPVEMASQDTSASSQAIIPVSPAPSDMGALAIVPLCKSKQSEIGQRRIRRPFTVGEVETLVGAVEQLGTGRWRAVKTLAFDNIEHRTYVDLKDKWKTLVHTASISQQQRRGQPVPQELLDRVLAAQAYWSQHLQDKPRGKARLLPEICFP